MKKNGFTIIELLGVILLLTIISLISVPIIINVITKLKIDSDKKSIEGYARSIEYNLNEYLMSHAKTKITNIENIRLLDIDFSDNFDGDEIFCSSESTDENGNLNLQVCYTEDSKNRNMCYNYQNNKVSDMIKCDQPEYKKGDIVVYKDEIYHIINRSYMNEDYVTLLKDIPLTKNEIKEYGQGHINTGTSYENIPYEFSNNYHGVAFGKNSSYDDSDIKFIVDNWAKSIEKDLKKVDNYKARLLKFDEIEKGYEDSEGFNHFHNLSSEYEWGYSKQWYWLMTPYQDYDDTVYFMSSGNAIPVNVKTGAAIRPVINLKKSAI